MNHDHHLGFYSDRIVFAELTETARHHLGWRELTQEEQEAVVTELREPAGGRTDLLDAGVDELMGRIAASSHTFSIGLRTSRADELARRLPRSAWQRYSAGPGAKGCRYYD